VPNSLPSEKSDEADRERRISDILRFEGGMNDLVKLSLERFARTTLPPLVCVETAKEMMELKNLLLSERTRKK
jgi:hypothetical protein